jgi:hypothetical protein
MNIIIHGPGRLGTTLINKNFLTSLDQFLL